MGIAWAFLCPDDEGGPRFAYGQNVVAMQEKRGLRLVEWLVDREPDHPAVAAWRRDPDGWRQDPSWRRAEEG